MCEHRFHEVEISPTRARVHSIHGLGRRAGRCRTETGSPASRSPSSEGPARSAASVSRHLQVHRDLPSLRTAKLRPSRVRRWREVRGAGGPAVHTRSGRSRSHGRRGEQHRRSGCGSNPRSAVARAVNRVCSERGRCSSIDVRSRAADPREVRNASTTCSESASAPVIRARASASRVD